MTGILVGFGGANAEVVAAVLIYRAFTIVPTLLLGLATMAAWRWLGPERRAKEGVGEPDAESARRVKEQSHKDEMSAAIRGDFERLRERGVAATLAPRDDDPPSLSTSADTLPDEPEAVVGPPVEPHAQPEIEIPAASGVQPERATRRPVRRRAGAGGRGRGGRPRRGPR